MQTTRNAIITNARVAIDREFILTVWLELNYGDSSFQQFGGYSLGGLPGTGIGNHAEQPNIAGEFLIGCMRAADVEEWSDMAGKSIRVRGDGDGFDFKITAIGHIVKDDRWFCPKERNAALLERMVKP